jgi:2-polyprenyl-6-methoxyphenol hydroxylase-like FAD-dependent oxidoreductase
MGAGLWTRGRVSLVGDAASCISLLGGQGSALAMVAAYILAGELHRSDGDYSRAFGRYQELFGPFVAKKQKSAERFGAAFAPKTSLGLFMRDWIMKAMAIPWVANLVAGKEFADKIALPNYS